MTGKARALLYSLSRDEAGFIISKNGIMIGKACTSVAFLQWSASAGLSP